MRRETTGARRLAKGKALVLGGLAASAVLCFGLFFGGVAWFVTAWLVFDDHRTADPLRHAPVAVFGLGILTSSLVAARFGMRVGRDWYRHGR